MRSASPKAIALLALGFLVGAASVVGYRKAHHVQDSNDRLRAKMGFNACWVALCDDGTTASALVKYHGFFSGNPKKYEFQSTVIRETYSFALNHSIKINRVIFVDADEHPFCFDMTVIQNPSDLQDDNRIKSLVSAHTINWEFKVLPKPVQFF